MGLDLPDQAAPSQDTREADRTLGLSSALQTYSASLWAHSS